jgi:hypothetical protein
MAVLALGTLFGAIKNRNDPISVAAPWVAEASTIVTVTCHFCRCFCLKIHPSVLPPGGKQNLGQACQLDPINILHDVNGSTTTELKE